MRLRVAERMFLLDLVVILRDYAVIGICRE